ncbi:hypothetical protein FE257_008817 [Aspergillus nanangensis]|uniref:Xylanolytic transcriptional activator regulatory domain-containing protein n=1 Tax=Aspergillus nanangensis TaxID=2582783 RepID=A0AAD4CL57_ASPNN|nr:hypothetical protein FE257_008817 [Aspergillus nanangensis]
MLGSDVRLFVLVNGARNQRCSNDNALCSFESMVQEELQESLCWQTPPHHGPGEVTERGDQASMDIAPQSAFPGPSNTFTSEQPISPTITPITDPVVDTREFRYATMLSLMNNNSIDKQSGMHQPVKLISGTNPLSALLGKDLKHTIVTNSCSFRTPDPVGGAVQSLIHNGSSLHSCDWESYYHSRGVSAARLQFMRAVHCFNLPPPAQCSQLLEIYFRYIHPMLPVVDRRDFLSMYYGTDNPPPLVLLQAVFLAASRYMESSGRTVDGIPEIRSHCDELHTKVRSLIEAEIVHERLAVIQASLIACLHWEGREGLNSALDSLSVAVRAGQEMGLHRKQGITPQSENDEQERLHRRIWWCTYTQDRWFAAQEGTPFIINEKDCNVEPLIQADLRGEDRVTSEVVLINLSLARVVEETVRCLYQAPEDLPIPSPLGVNVRQRLLQQLDTISDRIKSTLLSGLRANEALQMEPKSLSASMGSFTMAHLNAIRILVHRPFLLYCEPPGSGVQFSRNECRYHAMNILTDLEVLLEHGLLRYSWPFTVYAVVNCLLIFWYDLSSSSSIPHDTLQKSHRSYLSVVNLLRVLGDTWWAAAAKHKLALALAQAANVLLSQGRQTSTIQVTHREPSSAVTNPTSRTTQNLIPSPRCDAHSASLDSENNPFNMPWPATDVCDNFDLSGYNGTEFWSSLGLDFDIDVAANIFSIEPSPTL